MTDVVPLTWRGQDGQIARLILLNGPPGIGKSTLARAWVSVQEAAVVVEVDALRTSIDGWQDDDSSKLEARRMAIDVADAHLRRGYDVMVPQYLGRTEFIAELEQTAATASATFVEVMLSGDEDGIVARFEQRRAELGGADHPEHEVDDVRAAVAESIAHLELVAHERPRSIPLRADGNLEITNAELAAILEQ